MKASLTNEEWNAVVELVGADTAADLENHLKVFGDGKTQNIAAMCQYYFSLGYARAAVAAERRNDVKAKYCIQMSKVREDDSEDLRKRDA